MFNVWVCSSGWTNEPQIDAWPLKDLLPPYMADIAHRSAGQRQFNSGYSAQQLNYTLRDAGFSVHFLFSCFMDVHIILGISTTLCIDLQQGVD